MCPTEFIIEHLNSIMTVIIPSLIALAVGFVAFQQFLLAREKFKLDLFEKRLAIYKAVQIYLDEIRRNQDASDKLIKEFEANTHTSKFLFDSDVSDFIDEIYGMGIRLNLSNRPHESMTPRQRELSDGIREKVITDFMDYNASLVKRFLPYMKFKRWSNGLWLDFQNKNGKSQ